MTALSKVNANFATSLVVLVYEWISIRTADSVDWWHLNPENRYLFKLAWKNIRRNAGRSFFIGLSVALSVGIAVWIMAFFDGMNHQIEKAVVKGNVGYYQL